MRTKPLKSYEHVSSISITTVVMKSVPKNSVMYIENAK